VTARVRELRRYPALSARVKWMLGKTPPQEN
jgi:hypothetical protein